MKVAVVGKGFVGSQVALSLGLRALSLSELSGLRETTVINCIGYGGIRNIDDCEDDFERTWLSNVSVPQELGKLCAKVVHISSGCIFDGPSPNLGGWTEEDAPNLTSSAYCRTKLAGERALPDNALILRIRMPLAPFHHPRNIWTKVQSYSQVIHVQNSMTWLPTLGQVIRDLLDKHACGIYNVVSSDTVSPWELNPLAEQVTSLQGLTRAPRSNCVLSTAKLQKTLGYRLPTIVSHLHTHGMI